MKKETGLNIAIIVVGIVGMFQGWLEFLIGNVQFPLFMALFFFVAFALSWAIKNRIFPYICREGLKVNWLLIACCSWLIFTVFGFLAEGANIRTDLLITMPLVIITTSTSIVRLVFSLFGKSNNKAL